MVLLLAMPDDYLMGHCLLSMENCGDTFESLNIILLLTREFTFAFFMQREWIDSISSSQSMMEASTENSVVLKAALHSP